MQNKLHGYALLTPPNSHNIHVTFTSVRPKKHLTVRPGILNQLRSDIYGETTTSNKTLYSMSRFNKIYRRFTLSMRRHLKSHPLNYFMYHEYPRGYTYQDMGDPKYACGFCGALMWFDERLKKSPLSSLEFGLCCGRAKIQLPLLKQPPRLLRDLLQNRHIKSRNYIENIRAYNMMYAFTSMGGIQDKIVNNGHGTYTYRLGGNNYHLLGSLLPKEGDSPKFSQLYMYYGENETQDRIDIIRSKSPAAIDPSIVDDLKSMRDNENPIAQNFRMAAERFKESAI
ncbi:hypothetical protein OROMI_030372 [Orobanche minor]